ncbi:IgG-blocking protein M [Mycoplasma bradburyae]|uniref:IgG-blocking protein M n=1 Tax=Mycoplasma bradburyae TaxID=2963128 RepID=A0AAW6HPR0_9MOLU|nr:IgG-blocking protein M [Mycoplasma bradburyae]MDC4183294.1 IgG-blocking protein M [Mycoplasma bradburyae]UTS71067.1 IgG-blocking protein M [Mycoplasma bradburyae]
MKHKKYTLRKYNKTLVWIFSSVVTLSLLISGIVYTSVKISNSYNANSKSNILDNNDLPRPNILIGYQTIAKFKIENLEFELQKNLYSSIVNNLSIKSSVSLVSDEDDKNDNQTDNNKKPAPIKIFAKQKTNHTSDFISGYPDDDNNHYQSPYYYNDRVFMPILDSNQIYQKNERSYNDIFSNRYEGWNASDFNNINNKISYYKYEASSRLIEKINPSQTQVMAMNINLYQANSFFINETLKKYNPDFVILDNADNNIMKQLEFPSSVKKLTIKSNLLSKFDFNLSNNDIKELELYTPYLTEYNPLALNPDTHLIFDTALSKPFQEINLYGTSLTNEQALGVFQDVYVRRFYERYTQGQFSGGYITSLDFSNTGITSINNFIVKNLDENFDVYALSIKYSDNDANKISILKTDSWNRSENNVNVTIENNNTNRSIEDKKPKKVTNPVTNTESKERELRLVVSSEKEVLPEVVLRVVGEYLANNHKIKDLDISKIRLKNSSLIELAKNFKEKLSYLIIKN